MLVWEAHLALANSIGDSCLIDSTTISDGVRFSKALRDSYLYRAMLNVLNKRILQLKGLSNKSIEHIVSRYFPNSLQEIRFTLDNPPSNIDIPIADPDGRHIRLTYNNLETPQTPQPAIILGGRIRDLGYNNPRNSYPLPIKTNIDANGLLNGLSIQDFDNFMVVHYPFVQTIPSEYRPEIDIHSGFIDLTQTTTVEISLIIVSKPVNPALQLPTDILMTDNIYITEVLQQAIRYMQIDSQDYELTTGFSQLESETDKLMLNLPQQQGG